MRVAIQTLGCKVNQYETQAMERLLSERGHSVVPFTQEAEAYVVNTCSVTAVGDRKSRQAIRRLRREHPGAVVAVCGCYSQTHPEEVRELGVDLLAGSGGREQFLDLLEQVVSRRETVERVEKPGGAFEILPPGGMESRTRAMLKVEDGCVNFCAYCIIPYARGPVRSAPLETAVSQARTLAEEGYREIVLTGIEISSWGRDLRTGETLTDLMEAVCRAVPQTSIRLGSLEPRTVTEEFCRRGAALENLCPQFHLSLQSGCDETLRRMRRKYDTERYARSAELLRTWFRRPALTTDLITGFPGETEEEFETTLAFLRRCGFARMHIFPYSARPGTPAAAMDAQVPLGKREERARRAISVAAELRRNYLAGCVGERYEVLFEQPKGDLFLGRAPNYMEVLVRGTDLHNVIRPVRIIASDGDALYGELEEL